MYEWRALTILKSPKGTFLCLGGNQRRAWCERSARLCMRIRSLAILDEPERSRHHRVSASRTPAGNDADHLQPTERLPLGRERTRHHTCRRAVAFASRIQHRLLRPRRLSQISLRIADVTMRESQCIGACDCIWCEEVPVSETSPEDHKWLVERRHRILGDPQSTLREEAQKVQPKAGRSLLPATRSIVLEDFRDTLFCGIFRAVLCSSSAAKQRQSNRSRDTALRVDCQLRVR